MQVRADEVKGLQEKRAELVESMQELINAAETEKRAMSEEEQEKFDENEKEVEKIDKTIASKEKARNLSEKKNDAKNVLLDEENEEEKKEERAFENIIRGIVTEERAGELKKTENGAVIPSSIINKIIKKVEDICPIYKMATKYPVKGNISIPYYAEDGETITMAYHDEFKALTSTSGKFTSIQLSGYLAGALTKVSKSLANNSQFNIVAFVVAEMAAAITRFIESECLHGTEGKAEGLKGVKIQITSESATAITMDELIKLKDKVKDAFQGQACFIMNGDTRTALRLLKDGNGRYLMQDDVTSPFGTTLLGKPVYVSDQMDGMEGGKTAIYYGDMSGLAVKLSEEASVQVLQEKYADEHAIGVVAWMEFDAKIENAQKIAKLSMKVA